MSCLGAEKLGRFAAGLVVERVHERLVKQHSRETSCRLLKVSLFTVARFGVSSRWIYFSCLDSKK